MGQYVIHFSTSPRLYPPFLLALEFYEGTRNLKMQQLLKRSPSTLLLSLLSPSEEACLAANQNQFQQVVLFFTLFYVSYYLTWLSCLCIHLLFYNEFDISISMRRKPLSWHLAGTLYIVLELRNESLSFSCFFTRSVVCLF